jgi:hypothetical protein
MSQAILRCKRPYSERMSPLRCPLVFEPVRHAENIRR